MGVTLRVVPPSPATCSGQDGELLCEEKGACVRAQGRGRPPANPRTALRSHQEAHPERPRASCPHPRTEGRVGSCHSAEGIEHLEL